jgi:hypothetical protein
VANTPVSSSTVSTTRAAVATNASGDRAPLLSAAADFDRLPAGGSPAAHRTRSRLRPARAAPGRRRPTAVPDGVGLRDGQALGEADDDDRQGTGEHGADEVEGEPVPRHEREAGRDLADDLDTRLLQRQRGHEQDRHDDHDECCGHLRGNPVQREQPHERTNPDGHRWSAPRPWLGQDLHELLHRIALGLLRPDELGELPDGDVQAQPDDEAVQHRFGE